MSPSLEKLRFMPSEDILLSTPPLLLRRFSTRSNSELTSEFGLTVSVPAQIIYLTLGLFLLASFTLVLNTLEDIPICWREFWL